MMLPRIPRVATLARVLVRVAIRRRRCSGVALIVEHHVVRGRRYVPLSPSPTEFQVQPTTWVAARCSAYAHSPAISNIPKIVIKKKVRASKIYIVIS